MAKSKRNVLFDKAKEVESVLNKNIEQTNKILEKENIEELTDETVDIKQLPVTKTAQENTEKLEQFEMLIVENRSLNSKIDELTDKIAEYISEIEIIKKENIQLIENSKDSTILKNKVETLINEKEDLQIKISELTMENAKLLAEMSTIKENYTQQNVRTNPVNNPVQTHAQPVQNYKPRPNGYTNNGYGSWN